jgi:hypothetical protein
MKDPRTLGILEQRLRPEQILLDFVRLPAERRFNAQMEGLCW